MPKNIGRQREKTELNKKRLLEALEDNYGNISICQKKLGIVMSQIYVWREDDEYNRLVVQAVQRGKEKLVDLAEHSLAKNIINGREASILFTLKTQGKNRGYIEKSETELTGTINTVVIDWAGKYDSNKPVQEAT